MLVAGALETLATCEMLLVALEAPDKFFNGMKPKLSSLVGVGRPDEEEEKTLSKEEKAKVEQLNATSAPAPASPAAPAAVAPKKEAEGSSSTTGAFPYI